MIVDVIPVNIKAVIIVLSHYKELHLISYCKSINEGNFKHISNILFNLENKKIFDSYFFLIV